MRRKNTDRIEIIRVALLLIFEIDPTKKTPVDINRKSHKKQISTMQRILFFAMPFLITCMF